MTRAQLAKELRERACEIYKEEYLDQLSDDDIIEIQFNCPSCGKELIRKDFLNEFIDESRSLKQVLSKFDYAQRNLNVRKKIDKNCKEKERRKLKILKAANKIVQDMINKKE